VQKVVIIKGIFATDKTDPASVPSAGPAITDKDDLSQSAQGTQRKFYFFIAGDPADGGAAMKNNSAATRCRYLSPIKSAPQKSPSEISVGSSEAGERKVFKGIFATDKTDDYWTI
jgi:hypothetical protein